jgi:hypothetical protein
MASRQRRASQESDGHEPRQEPSGDDLRVTFVPSDESPKFHYESINWHARSIRLLELLPPNGQISLRFKLREFATATVPRYIALSYNWGITSDATHSIECNEMPMRVRKNLYGFLVLYQRHAEPGTLPLWVDAICVNQDNIEERNHQVALMREIYASATLVIAWLGGEIKDAALAFSLIDGPFGLKPDDDKEECGKSSYHHWRSLRSLFRRSYWERIWIVQEFILPRNVEIWCGELKASAT